MKFGLFFVLQRPEHLSEREVYENEVAEMVATAALERRESRGSYSHFRADFPHRDDANWRKMVVLKKQPDGYAVEHRAIELADRPAERTSAHINQ